MAEHKFLDDKGLASYDNKIKKVIVDGDAMPDELTVELGTNGSLGGYKTGDTIEKGTPIEKVIKKLLAKQIPPTYTAPTIKIANNSGDASGAYEYGSKVTPKLKATFTKNDAGALTSIKIKKGSTEVASGTTSPLTYNGDEITLTGTVSFSATASYDEGAIKNDNLGDPYSEGHITSGSKTTTSNFSYTVYREGYFWGILDTSSAEEPITSDIIRSGTAKGGAYAKETIGTKEAPVIKASLLDNRKRIFVACPADKTGVTTVTMPSAMNATTSSFKKLANTVDVEGANGATAVAYNVWVYEPALISNDQTFVITLG